MTSNLSTVAYIGATILFILSLGGLSNQETARRGNLYGMVGMTIAVLATVFGPRVTMAGIPWIIGAMVVGGAIGIFAARTVKMTQMPELAALLLGEPLNGWYALGLLMVLAGSRLAARRPAVAA